MSIHKKSAVLLLKVELSSTFPYWTLQPGRCCWAEGVKQEETQRTLVREILAEATVHVQTI